MDGDTFVSKLQFLSLKSAEHLKGNDFDWIFCQDYNQTFSSFWNLFFDNISNKDLLSDKEIKSFSTIEANGDVLSSELLRKASLDLMSDDSEDEISRFLCSQDFLKEDEADIIHQEIDDINERRKFISLQKMQLKSKLNAKRKRINILKQKIEATKQNAQKQCKLFTDLQQEAQVQALDKISYIEKAKTTKEASRFFSRSMFEDFVLTSQDERKFSESVEEFRRLHLKEDLNTYFGGNNFFWSAENDSHSVWQSYTSEVTRVTRMNEDISLSAIDTSLERARANAEIEEGLGFMGRLREGWPLTPSDIRQQLSEDHRINTALEQDLSIATKDLKFKSTFLAHKARFNMILEHSLSAAFRRKLILDRCQMLRGVLLKHMARLDLLRVLRDCDVRRLRLTKVILARIDRLVFSEHQEAQLYLNRLESENNKSTSSDTERIVAEESETAVIPVGSSEKRNRVAFQTQMEYLNKLFGSCSALEIGMFGVRGLPPRLPCSWLDPETEGRKKNALKNLAQFQKDIKLTMTDYEKKKTTVQENQELSLEMKKWTKW